MDSQEKARLTPENRATRRFPQSNDPRCQDGSFFPTFQPKFPLQFNKDTTVFAIGSCFARNIEEALAPTGVRLPTYALKTPPTEKKGRARGLINEFTPGCIHQRILSALEGRQLSEKTIVPQGTGYADLLLPTMEPVTLDRAKERRKEIDAIYGELARADLVVITLGYVESWYDQETNLYLNRRPYRLRTDAQSNRYVFRRLDVDDCMELLKPAVDAMTRRGLKILLTVSPVPLGTTFSDDDCVVANEFSKSVLRVCADRLSRHDSVEYFPSYEIVRSGGSANYIEDNTHVRPEVVEKVTRYMISSYAELERAIAAKVEAGAAGSFLAKTLQRFAR